MLTITTIIDCYFFLSFFFLFFIFYFFIFFSIFFFLSFFSKKKDFIFSSFPNQIHYFRLSPPLFFFYFSIVKFNFFFQFFFFNLKIITLSSPNCPHSPPPILLFLFFSIFLKFSIIFAYL